jgi:WD40 repeat protein
VAFSPDGAILAAAGQQKVVRLYDASSGSPLRDLSGHKDAIYSLAFSPDGKTLASASRDFTVTFWHVATGEPVGRLERIGYVDSIAFSVDGRSLVTSDDLQVWDVATGAKTRKLGPDCYSIAFSPDGATLACGWGKAIKLFDFASGNELLTTAGHAVGTERIDGFPPSPQVTSVAMSPDGRTMASGSFDSTVRLWDVQTGTELHAFKHPHLVYSTAFSPDGRLLAVAATSIYLWDTSTRAAVRNWSGHDEYVIRAVAFSPDGRRLVSAGSEGQVKLWDASSGRLVAALK